MNTSKRWREGIFWFNLVYTPIKLGVRLKATWPVFSSRNETMSGSVNFEKKHLAQCKYFSAYRFPCPGIATTRAVAGVESQRRRKLALVRVRVRVGCQGRWQTACWHLAVRFKGCFCLWANPAIPLFQAAFNVQSCRQIWKRKRRTDAWVEE